MLQIYNVPGAQKSILRRLRYPNGVIEAVVPMVARHMQFMNVQNMRVARLKRFMSEPTFEQEMELHRVDCGSSNGFTDNYEFLQAKGTEFANEPLIPPPLPAIGRGRRLRPCVLPAAVAVRGAAATPATGLGPR